MPDENRTILKTADAFEIVASEQQTLLITGTLLDETKAPIQAAQLATLTLTLYARDHATKAIVNSVDHVNILNTGRGTIHATTGTLSILLEPADNSVVNDALDQEWHRALIEGTYASTKKFKYEIDFPVRNLAKVS